MKHCVGEIIRGTVTKVKPYALFLSFEDGSNGLLHISEISDSYIRDIEKFGTKGDEMNARILAIDEQNGFMRLSLKDIPSEKAFNSHTNSKRSNLQDDDGEFKLLKEKLPQWINDSLKKESK